MMRHRLLRWRLAALYEGFRQLDEWALGAGGADPRSARLSDLAAVTLAVTFLTITPCARPHNHRRWR
jgi:hypothetical protein